MRRAISEGGGDASLAAKGGIYCGGQGVHREVESEGHEEKYRAVIEGHHPKDELVGRGWGKVELAVWKRRRFSFTHQKHGDCGRHGTEESCVTSGGLTGSPVALEKGTL